MEQEYRSGVQIGGTGVQNRSTDRWNRSTDQEYRSGVQIGGTGVHIRSTDQWNRGPIGGSTSDYYRAYYYKSNRSKIGGVKQRGSPAAKCQTITVDNG